jgi:hypothetical protein
MADNDDDLVDYDEEEVRLLPRSFIGGVSRVSGVPRQKTGRIGSFKVRYNLAVESYVDSFPFSLRCGKKSKATTEHTSSPPCTLHSNPIQSIRYLLAPFLDSTHFNHPSPLINLHPRQPSLTHSNERANNISILYYPYPLSYLSTLASRQCEGYGRWRHRGYI